MSPNRPDAERVDILVEDDRLAGIGESPIDATPTSWSYQGALSFLV